MDVAIGDARRGYILLLFQLVCFFDPLLDIDHVVDYVLSFVDT